MPGRFSLGSFAQSVRSFRCRFGIRLAFLPLQRDAFGFCSLTRGIGQFELLAFQRTCARLHLRIGPRALSCGSLGSSFSLLLL